MVLRVSSVKNASLGFQAGSLVLQVVGMAAPYWTWIGDHHHGLWLNCHNLQCQTWDKVDSQWQAIQGFMCSSLCCNILAVLCLLCWRCQSLRHSFTYVTTVWMIFALISGILTLAGVFGYFIIGASFSWVFCAFSGILSCLNAVVTQMGYCFCGHPSEPPLPLYRSEVANGRAAVNDAFTASNGNALHGDQ